MTTKYTNLYTPSMLEIETTMNKYAYPNKPGCSPTSPTPLVKCGNLTTPRCPTFDTEKRKRIEQILKDLNRLSQCDLDDCINQVTAKKRRRDWARFCAEPGEPI